MTIRTSLVSLAVSLAASATSLAYAKAAIVYEYDTHARVIGVSAIVGIEAPMIEVGDNCSQRIADVVVADVVYRERGVITAFRAKKPPPKEWYGEFRIDSNAIYRSLPNAKHLDVQKIIHKGAHLMVIYQMCGSGGFASVREIFKNSAVNNP